MVIVLVAGNWLAGAGVLAVGILAFGAAVPWHGLLLAYAGAGDPDTATTANAEAAQAIDPSGP